MKTGQHPTPAALDSNETRMNAVWQQRATRLAGLADLVDGQNARPVIVLGIGKERYGIDLADVAEVLPPVFATPVPGAAAIFCGVLNVHGEILPVIDLRRFLGMEIGPETIANRDSGRVILLRQNGRELGLRTDSVEQIRWIGPADLQSRDGSGADISAHVKGSTKDLLMLLRAEALFAGLDKGGTV
jgi:purine-binding chemotaxis protein CheW